MARKTNGEVNININAPSPQKKSAIKKVVGFFKRKGKTHPLSFSPPSAVNQSLAEDVLEADVPDQNEDAVQQPKDVMEQFKEEIEAKARSDLWSLRAGNRIVMHNTLGKPVGVLIADNRSPDHEVIHKDLVNGDEETISEKRAYEVLKDHYARELSLPI